MGKKGEAERLHLVDLDGAFEGRPQIVILLRKLSASFISRCSWGRLKRC